MHAHVACLRRALGCVGVSVQMHGEPAGRSRAPGNVCTACTPRHVCDTHSAYTHMPLVPGHSCYAPWKPGGDAQSSKSVRTAALGPQMACRAWRSPDKANCEAHSLHNRRTKSKVETFLICSDENHRLAAATHAGIRAVAVTVLAPARCHAAPWPLSTWQRLQLVAPHRALGHVLEHKLTSTVSPRCPHWCSQHQLLTPMRRLPCSRSRACACGGLC